MTVIDARNKRVLWSASEAVKLAMKEKAKENNLVGAAERLASKFHDRLEPPAQ
jgi:K+-sensing histidine kinase KdpD